MRKGNKIKKIRIAVKKKTNKNELQKMDKKKKK